MKTSASSVCYLLPAFYQQGKWPTQLLSGMKFKGLLVSTKDSGVSIKDRTYAKAVIFRPLAPNFGGTVSIKAPKIGGLGANA